MWMVCFTGWRVFVDGVPLLGPHYCLPNGQVRGIPYNADASPSCVASMATQSFPENIIAPAFRVSCWADASCCSRALLP